MSLKIYVVSLAGANDRKRFMSSQLRKLDIEFKIIDACDAREISDEDASRVNEGRLSTHKLTKGEIACAMSHAKACKALSVDGSCDYGLIIEDDVILSEKLHHILCELQHKGLDSSITLLFSAIFKPVTLHKYADLSFGYGLVSPDNLDTVFGTVAYFLSREKAREFSSYILPIRQIVDNWKSHVENEVFSSVKLVYPFPVLHAELLSAINEKNSGEKISIRTYLKNIIYYKRIFPLYEIFLWKRRKDAEKRQRKNILSPQFKDNKTYKL